MDNTSQLSRLIRAAVTYLRQQNCHRSESVGSGFTARRVISGFLAAVSQTTNPVGTGPAATTLFDQMPDSLSFANSYVVGHNNVCLPLAPGVVSRKIHGNAGPFDLSLPSTGTATVECRSGGANNAYTIIYTFATNLGFGGTASPTQGTATVGSPVIGPNLNQITVPLTNVANVQHLAVTLTGILDAAHNPLASQTALMDVLVGDVNQSRHVDSGDLGQAQRQNSQPVTSSNFRSDVNASGHIDAGDIAVIQRMNSTGLQP